MKRMWAKEQLSGGGGGLYMHKVHAQHVSELDTSFIMYIMSTAQTPFTSAREIPKGAYLAEGLIYDSGSIVTVFQIRYAIAATNTVLEYVGEDSGSIMSGTAVYPIGDIEFTDEVSEL